MTDNVFTINSKGTCLLCLTDCHNEVGHTRSSVAFKMLLRYLKIDVLKLSHFSSTFLHVLDGPDSMDILVSLCGRCGSTTTYFLKLFQDMERIRMELDNCAGIVHEAIKEGGEDESRVRKYRERIKPERNSVVPEDALNASIAENVRKEIMTRCAVRLTYSVPRVVVRDEDEAVPAMKASNPPKDKIEAIQKSCLTTATVPIRPERVHPRDTVEALENAFKETLEKYTLKVRSILAQGEDELPVTVENTSTTSAPESEKIDKHGSSISASNLSLVAKRRDLQVENESVDATDVTSLMGDGLIDVETIEIRNTDRTTNALKDISLTPTQHDPLEISDMEDDYASVASSVEDTTVLHHDPLEITNNYYGREADFQLNDPGMHQQVIFALEMARGGDQNEEEEIPLNDVVVPIRDPVPKSKYKCSKCEKSFNSLSHLWHHNQDVHLGVKLQCNHCSKTFTHSSSAKTRLRIHVAMEHTFQIFNGKFPVGTTEEEFTEAVEMMLPQVSMSSVRVNRTGRLGMRYKCKLCESLLMINEPRKSHICQKHLDDVIYMLRSMKGKIEKYC